MSVGSATPAKRVEDFQTLATTTEHLAGGPVAEQQIGCLREYVGC